MPRKALWESLAKDLHKDFKIRFLTPSPLLSAKHPHPVESTSTSSCWRFNWSASSSPCSRARSSACSKLLAQAQSWKPATRSHYVVVSNNSSHFTILVLFISTINIEFVPALGRLVPLYRDRNDLIYVTFSISEGLIFRRIMNDLWKREDNIFIVFIVLFPINPEVPDNKT